MVSIKLANPHFFPEILEWLKAERDQGGAGFYCNRHIIEKSFASGEGLCAFVGGRIVGFAVFQMYADGGDVHIIEVEPLSRRLGLGSQLLLAAVEALRGLGANYVDVECTSLEGEALCRRHGFEDYVDPRNYRSEADNPLLRLYLSEWRPRPSNLEWA